MTTATTTGATTSSPAALEAALIREDFKAKAYKDTGGKWSVGIGFTMIEREGALRPVEPGDVMTKAEALDYLRVKWAEHERLIPHHITRPLTQNQFDVLADMAFQFGVGFLRSGAGNTTGLREAINAGAWEKVDREIARWYYVKGERDAGVYSRALSRICQWHGLPWRWIYQALTPDVIVRNAAGKIVETPFIKLDSDGEVRELVTPETALARARAFAAAAAATVPKAPETPRVPADPAPSPAPQKPVLVVKPPPGVVLKEAPASPPSPPVPPPPQKAQRPVISISDPYEPVPVKSTTIDKLPLPGIDPEKPPKPMTDAQRFWGLFWIGFGNILQAAALRGLTFGGAPAWVTYLMVDAVRDPVILGMLTAATVALVSGLLAAPAIIRTGINRLRKGDAEATQLTY